jgi:hypothetical protein
MSLDIASAAYRAIRDRIRAQDPDIDEVTLADTVEGCTNVHQILEAIIRAALQDEALAIGLKMRMGELQQRLNRLEDRAFKRRVVAKDVMVDCDIKKLQASDFTASIRPGTPALMVIDESAVPSIYWDPGKPKLKRRELMTGLGQGYEIAGVSLANPEPVLSVRTK